MTRQILQWCKVVRDNFVKEPGRVLEVGSLNVNGTVRDVFQPMASEYIGIDMTEGKGVDIVMNAHDLLDKFGPESFDIVICSETLEHDNKPWVTVPQLHALLKPAGILIVTTPTTGFPEHRYPCDYFRYMEDAYREFIFENITILNISLVKDDAGYPGICCVGRKPLDS